MYSRQLVILFVNENRTAEKGWINQTLNEFLCFLINYSSHISAALNAQKLCENASDDEDLSAVNMPIQFVS